MLTITISPREQVLCIEDMPTRQRWFIEHIPWAQITDLAHLANLRIRQTQFDVIFIDWDLHHLGLR